ncbi:MAG: carboxypeptidase regulatory-like domain-containing protein, partial [Planctomycetota bacterium]
MKRQIQVRVAVAGLCLILACAAAWGQATTATVLGTVKDSTGASVPDANVTAINTDTNFSRLAVSDPTGHYVIQFLPVGTYRLEVEAAGFKKFVQSGIVLEVDRNARIDPLLTVGAVTESVEVTSDAPLVDTTKVALGQTVSNAEILNLPLVGRDVYGLLSVTGGVQNNESTNDFGPPGQRVSVYGSSNAGTGGVNFTLDGGMSVQSLRNSGNPAPNPDAVQEFRITTHMFDAEYGRFGGGVVNVITKSGTNTYHGTLFESLRNDRLNAQQWNTLQKDRVRRNQFGGSFGGPIKKDKLFFFSSYSGL